ncbi:hypothetical protein C3E90_09070 [Clostridium sp. Cult2]|nr:hypothetical protein [Clostridium sp. Cult2]
MVDGGEKLILRGKVLVANTGDDTLTFIDFDDKNKETIDLLKIASHNTRRTIRLEGYLIGPYDIVSNGHGYIYCTNVYDNSVFKMDLNNNKIIDILAVGSYPTCIKYFDKHLYVTNTDSNSISIIDEESFSLVENIPVGEKPTYIEIDEINMNIYVANSNGYSIDVISLKENNHSIIKLCNNPIKITLFENHIYILSNVNNGLDNNSNISIINLETYKEESNTQLEGIFSNMLKINNREIIFITSMENGYIYRMDIRGRNLLSKTYLKGMPNKLEWNGENTLFISNISTNMLTLFDINENRIIKNIKVGREPNGILIFY